MSDLISDLFRQVLGFLDGIQSLEGEQKPELWAIFFFFLNWPGVMGRGALWEGSRRDRASYILP